MYKKRYNIVNVGENNRILNLYVNTLCIGVKTTELKPNFAEPLKQKVSQPFSELDTIHMAFNIYFVLLNHLNFFCSRFLDGKTCYFAFTLGLFLKATNLWEQVDFTIGKKLSFTIGPLNWVVKCTFLIVVYAWWMCLVLSSLMKHVKYL